MTSPSDRFWSQVDRQADNECWRWRGARGSGGRYGAFWLAGRTVSAHRAAFELSGGTIPANMVVMHTCDNTLCVNPLHLQIGTQLDNIKDRDQKKRTATGDRASVRQRAKLSKSNVRQIRLLRRMGMSRKLVADKFEICEKHVSAICHKRAWKDVD